MESVSVSKLKASLSHYLAMVKRGEEVLVTDRNRPVARLLPVAPDLGDRERLLEMARQGRVRLPERWPTKESWEEFDKLPFPEDPEGLVLKALLEEREENRQRR